MLWQKNTCNYWHTLTWSPLLHDNSVFRLWIQRIKKSKQFKNAQIEYALALEYGSKYHRPHAHCIFLSSVPLTIDAFRTSWPYGKIEPSTPDKIREYDDLFADGSMDFCTTKSAKKSVKYVTKYTIKANEQIKQHGKYHAITQVCKLLTDGILPTGYIFKFSKYQLQKLAAIQQTKSFNKYAQQVNQNPTQLALHALVRLFTPRTSLSRSPCLGSLYASNHLSQLLAHDLRLPTLQTPTSPQAIANKLHSDQHASTPTLLQPRSYSRIRSKITNPYIIYKSNHSGYSSASLPSYPLFCDLLSFMDELLDYFAKSPRSLLRYRSTSIQNIRFVKITPYVWPERPQKYYPLNCLIDGYQITQFPPHYSIGHLYHTPTHTHYTLYLAISVDDYSNVTPLGYCFGATYHSSDIPQNFVPAGKLLHEVLQQLENNYQDYADSIETLDSNTRCYLHGQSVMKEIYDANLSSILEEWRKLKETKQNEQEQKNPSD